MAGYDVVQQQLRVVCNSKAWYGKQATCNRFSNGMVWYSNLPLDSGSDLLLHYTGWLLIWPQCIPSYCGQCTNCGRLSGVEFAYLEVVLPSTGVQMWCGIRWWRWTILVYIWRWASARWVIRWAKVDKHSVYLEVYMDTGQVYLDTCSLYLEVRRKKRTKAHKTKLEAASE